VASMHQCLTTFMNNPFYGLYMLVSFECGLVQIASAWCLSVRDMFGLDDLN